MRPFLILLLFILALPALAGAGTWQTGDPAYVKVVCAEPGPLYKAAELLENDRPSFANASLVDSVKNGECAYVGSSLVIFIKSVGRQYNDKTGGSQVWQVESRVIKGYVLVNPNTGIHEDGKSI